MNLEQVHRFAEKLWDESNDKGIARRKCDFCFNSWRMNGKRQEEKPPVFPPSFEGPCPSCGKKLSRPSIPF